MILHFLQKDLPSNELLYNIFFAVYSTPKGGKNRITTVLAYTDGKREGKQMEQKHGTVL